MAEVHVESLTKCEVSSDGRSIALGFDDRGGNPATVQIAVGQAGALAMTLPRLIEEAIRWQYRDQSLRYTYPLGSWTLERATD